jgi:two-component system, OmpR family, response regulator
VRLLIVEDEADLARALQKSLEEHDFAVDLSSDGEEGLYKVTQTSYDAAILDVMLPRLDGWTVLRRVRASGNRTPVLMLTARDTVDDRVRGLNLGADDYLVKPFAVAELVARIRAVIRRAYGGASSEVTVADLSLDTVARTVCRDGNQVDLTAREYTILELLVRSRGRPVSRPAIAEHIYSEATDVWSNVIDVHVAALRRKLGTSLIRTRRGEGYIIDA